MRIWNPCSLLAHGGAGEVGAEVARGTTCSALQPQGQNAAQAVEIGKAEPP